MDSSLNIEMKKSAGQIASISLDQLLRPELGPSGFSAFRSQFEPLWKLLQFFEKADLSLVPDAWLHHVNRGLGVLRAAVDAMRNHQADPNQPPAQQRSSAIKPLLDLYNEFYDALVRVVSLGLHFPTAERLAEVEHVMSDSMAMVNKAIESKRSEFSEALNATTKDVLQRLNGMEAAARDALESIRRAAGAAGVGRESTQFNSRANAHKKQGTTWLAATGTLVILTAVYAYALAFRAELVPYSGEPRALVVQVAGRLVLASLLLWALAVCQRNYKAHRHNEILNRHRQTSLTTFETFVAATANPEIKDAVLIQTTQSIFSVQPTGYLPNEPEATPQTTVVEILRRFAEKP